MSENPSLDDLLALVRQGVITSDEAIKLLAASRQAPAAAESNLDEPVSEAEIVDEADTHAPMSDPTEGPAAKESLYDTPSDNPPRPRWAQPESDATFADSHQADAHQADGAQDPEGDPIDDFAKAAGSVFSQIGGIASELGSIAGATFRSLGNQFTDEKQSSEVAEQPAQPTQPNQTARDWKARGAAAWAGVTGQTVTGPSGIKRVSIRGVGRRIRVVADPSVESAVISGPHELRRLGDILEITTAGQARPNLGAFSPLRGGFNVDLKAAAVGEEVVIRMNPMLPLDAEVTGGKLTTTGIENLGRVRVSVGGGDFADVKCAADVLIQACSARIQGSLSSGYSHLRVESGRINVALDANADVMIRSDVHTGQVSWPQGERVSEYSVGSGRARIDLTVVMGRAVVTAAGYGTVI